MCLLSRCARSLRKWDINEWPSSLGSESPCATPSWAQCLLGSQLIRLQGGRALDRKGLSLPQLARRTLRRLRHYALSSESERPLSCRVRRVHEQGGGGRGGAQNAPGETVAALRSHDAELTRLDERFEALKSLGYLG